MLSIERRRGAEFCGGGSDSCRCQTLTLLRLARYRSYVWDGKTRSAAQKTVVIPSQGAVFVLQLNSDSLQSDQGPLMDATKIVDDQATITVS